MMDQKKGLESGIYHVYELSDSEDDDAEDGGGEEAQVVFELVQVAGATDHLPSPPTVTEELANLDLGMF